MNTEELHLIRFEELYERYMADPSEEGSSLLIAETVRLIRKENPVIICGLNHDGKTDPQGYYGPDGRFYFHVFTGMEKLLHSGFGHPAAVRLSDLYGSALTNDIIGGISLNYAQENGALLINKEDLSEGLALYDRLHGVKADEK